MGWARSGLAVLALLLAAVSARAAEPLDWVGRDPFEKRDELSFFDHPAVLSQLARLTIPVKLETLRSPFGVERQGELLVAFLCDRRDCAQRNWALLYDLSSGEAALCDYRSQVSAQQMTYSLTLTRSFLSARLDLQGTLSQALPNGCLDPDASNLAALWAVARQLLN